MPKKVEDVLLPLVQRSVRALPYSFPDGMFVVVDAVKVDGPHLRTIRVALTTWFLDCERGHCCGEPGCYSMFFWPSEGRLAIARYLRRRLRLRHPVEVEFDVKIEIDPALVHSRRRRAAARRLWKLFTE